MKKLYLLGILFFSLPLTARALDLMIHPAFCLPGDLPCFEFSPANVSITAVTAIIVVIVVLYMRRKSKKK